MEKIAEVMKAVGALPKLRLGEKLERGGVKSYGPKQVKFLSEPVGCDVKKMGHKAKALRFEVEYEGTRYYWYVEVLSRETGQLHYLMERLLEVKPGEERILEMRKQGAINYIDVRLPGEAAKLPDEDEGEDVIDYGELDKQSGDEGAGLL